MYFDPTPQSVTSLLVIVLAVFALYQLTQGRYDTNLPLSFYTATMFVGSFTEQTVHPYLLFSGISFAMVLRFEFMSKGFTRFMGVLTSLAISGAILALFDQILGGGQLF
jgi:hypothetical protein